MAAVRRGPMAAFLFGSGACALVYQVVWTRELRLVFGATSSAAAAVLAIFIGGLGIGGLVLGRRADRHPNPLMLYANLETAVAVSAACTPLFIWLARLTYHASGGTEGLGTVGGTALRLLLSTIVLGVPTFLMGGTLPAATQAAQTAEDLGRKHTSLLYGANTLGAVTGSLASTFVLAEVFGTRLSLWIACLVNLLVAMLARGVARSGRFAVLRGQRAAAPKEAGATGPALPPRAPASFVLGAALASGFVFFLMELVWFRMLGPLLGGSLYTFGLILAVALLGIGLGGLAYAELGQDRPATLSAFALTSVIEALALAIPFALGDRLAVLTVGLRSLGGLGFGGLATGWAIVTAVVVLPAAFASGVQFPLLIALLGRGDEHVGRQVGLTYGWNTAGAILGSLAGGFGLMPALTATGTWRLVGFALVALGLTAAVLDVWQTGRRFRPVVPAVLAIVTLSLLTSTGPTSAWRHSPIGAGRTMSAHVGDTPRSLRAWRNDQRAHVIWEREGLEASIALRRSNDTSFHVNGKSDGSFRADAGTQVMLGLLGACLHDGPRRAYVIGLGTGSSAGWLADFPGIERVDVAEIEPAIVEVAARASTVNRNALKNPRLHVHLADAREGLLTAKQPYDLIVSEPSNPFRVGISSLFTREYYEAGARRLAPGGLFVQWVQAYEIDAETLRSIYATIASVYPFVETWQSDRNDLVLVASPTPRETTLASLRRCFAHDLMKEALSRAWYTDTVEGMLAHYVATPRFATHLQKSFGDGQLNTDDLNSLEFGFARNVGKEGILAVDILRASHARGEGRPPIREGVDWEGVDDELATMGGVRERVWTGVLPMSPDRERRAAALQAYAMGDVVAAGNTWRGQPRPPRTLVERALIGDALAAVGDPYALHVADTLVAERPFESEVIRARAALHARSHDEALTHLLRAFERLKTDPWPLFGPAKRALTMAIDLARAAPKLAPPLYDALKTPFVNGIENDDRLDAVFGLARIAGWSARCREVLAAYEPHVPWTREVLGARADCYEKTNDPRAELARDELVEWLSTAPGPIDPDVPPTDHRGEAGPPAAHSPPPAPLRDDAPPQPAASASSAGADGGRAP